MWGTWPHPHSVSSCAHALCVCHAHTWPCTPGGVCAVPIPPRGRGQAWPHWALTGDHGTAHLWCSQTSTPSCWGWSWRDRNPSEHRGCLCFPVLHVLGASCGFLGRRISLSCSWQEFCAWGSAPGLPWDLCSGGGSAPPQNPALCPLSSWADLKGLESPPDTRYHTSAGNTDMPEYIEFRSNASSHL